MVACIPWLIVLNFCHGIHGKERRDSILADRHTFLGVPFKIIVRCVAESLVLTQITH